MNIDILHRPTALENLLAGRIWPAGRRLPMHVINYSMQMSSSLSLKTNTKSVYFFNNVM